MTRTTIQYRTIRAAFFVDLSVPCCLCSSLSLPLGISLFYSAATTCSPHSLTSLSLLHTFSTVCYFTQTSFFCPHPQCQPHSHTHAHLLIQPTPSLPYPCVPKSYLSRQKAKVVDLLGLLDLIITLTILFYPPFPAGPCILFAEPSFHTFRTPSPSILSSPFSPF